MFGNIQLAEFEGLTKFPQKAASAWSAVEGLIGATYKPLLFVGTRTVRGTNYVFIAEETLITNPPERRLVLLEVNEFEGEFDVVESSITRIA